MKILDSDEEENEPEDERDQIAQDIFAEEEEDDVRSVRSARPQSRQSEKYTAITDIGDESEEEEEGVDDFIVDDFIVDDDNQPIKTKKIRRKNRYTDRLEFKNFILFIKPNISIFNLNNFKLFKHVM